MTLWSLALPIFLVAPRAAKSDPTFEAKAANANPVAQLFVSAMLANQTDALVDLGTDPFTFDGRVVKGRANIKQTWQAIQKHIDEDLREQRDARMEILSRRKAYERYGPAPKKFSHLKLSRCLFAVIRFKSRPGMMLILTEAPKSETGWLVTAVTD